MKNTHRHSTAAACNTTHTYDTYAPPPPVPLPAVPAAAAAAAAPGTLEGPERGGGDGVLIKRGCPIAVS